MAAAKAPGQLMPLAKTAGMGFVGGLLIYGASDVLGEYTTFIKLQERGLELANNSSELKDQIGHPFTTGPWYNGRIGFTAGGNLAQCTFQLQGTKQITDVTVRGLRGAGSASRAIYNIWGPGAWTIVDCTAMFPAGGGLVQPKSLLPATAPKKTQGDTSKASTVLETQSPASSSVSASNSPANRPAADQSASHGQQGDKPIAPTARRSWYGWGQARSQPGHGPEEKSDEANRGTQQS